MNNTFGPALESGPSSWEPAMQKTQMSHRYQFTEIHQVDQAFVGLEKALLLLLKLQQKKLEILLKNLA